MGQFALEPISIDFLFHFIRIIFNNYIDKNRQKHDLDLKSEFIFDFGGECLEVNP